MLPVRRPSALADDVDGFGVFVPGLMGAGLLVSMAMLLADGLRRLVPHRGHRARAMAVAQRVRGRVHDLAAVPAGVAPTPWRAHRVPRRGGVLAAVGVGLVGMGVAAAAGAVAVYHGHSGVLSDRGWTLAAGFLAAVPAGLAGLAAVAAGALGRARPSWLARLAAFGALGRWPGPDELVEQR